MLEADPPSAWQPPASAANVHCVAMNTPISPLASNALAIVSSSCFKLSAIAITAPGSAAQRPP